MMRSQRRGRLLFYTLVALVVCILFYTGSLRHQRYADGQGSGDEFWERTTRALNRQGAQQQQQQHPGRGQQVAQDGARTQGDAAAADGADAEPFEKDHGVQDRLNAAAKQAKQLANMKAPKPDAPSKVRGVGSSAEGNGVLRPDKDKDAAKDVDAGGGDTRPGKQGVLGAAHESEEQHDVEVEMNAILKRSPIIIFSKTHCPHSKRAKSILLEAYHLEPAPYVVELDQHELGPRLQARLAELTSRRTVPNILVNGVSIGGGDEVAALDADGTLIEKIRDLAGKKMTVAAKQAKGL